MSEFYEGLIAGLAIGIAIGAILEMRSQRT